MALCTVRRTNSVTFALLSLLLMVNMGKAQSESANVPPAWQTVAEKTDYKKTSTYDETIAFCKKLDAASPLIVYKSYGKGGEGRDLPLLIAASGGGFTPAAGRAQNKGVIFIQGGVQAGENDGQEARPAPFCDNLIT